MFRAKTNFAEISIDSDSPDRANKIVINGENPVLVNRFESELSTTTGFRGHLLGDRCSPLDLKAALMNLDLWFEIIEGAEILEMPQTQLPEGAID